MKLSSRPSPLSLFLYSLLAGLLIGISALLIFLLVDRLQEPVAESSDHFLVTGADEYDGIINIAPALAIPDFTLDNAKGSRTSLSDLRGRHVLLTFGFTHCPDVCPLTLNDFRRIRSQLGNIADRIHFVFISVDGQRDTPGALRQYFDFRELNHIIALTGSEADVRALGAPLGLAFEVSDEPTQSGYLVNHTAGSFLLDGAGHWIKRFQFGLPPSTIAADLRKLLSA